MPRRNGTGIALLADPTRRRIIAVLAEHPHRPSAVAARIGLSRPATSRQLHLLLRAGLVRAIPSRVDGRGWVYLIDPTMHGRITAWLAGTDVGLGDADQRDVGRTDIARREMMRLEPEAGAPDLHWLAHNAGKPSPTGDFD